MKCKKSNHWTNKTNQAGLLFFAQVLDEALFDYTLDSFKPQALNPRLICIEILKLIESINSGLLKAPSLKPVIEELVHGLSQDVAIREMLGVKLDRIVERIRANENNLKDLKVTIAHLYHHLDNKKYLEKIQSLLIELIPANQEKEHIYYLTKTYLTELINYGYNPGHIYYKTNLHFFNKDHPVNDLDPKPFFELFDFNKRKYSIIYRANDIFKEFEPISQLLKFEIRDTFQMTSLRGTTRRFIEEKTSDEVFIVFENIDATDEITARYTSDVPMTRITNLFSFYHHKEKPNINDKALVINHIDNTSIIVDRPIKSIIKKEDIKPKKAALKVKGLFESLDLPQKSLYSLIRAMDIHSIALETNELENKLLNLWTAIESLIPKNVESGNDRIVQIMRGLVPFQTVNYIKNLINQTASDFFFFNNRLATNTLNGVTTLVSEDRWYKTCAFIATKENDSNRTSVYASLDDFPLLRYRIFWLNKQFTNGKSLVKLIKNHMQRVEWQIQRIYRVRNLIVHSGTMPPYTNILVENLHNYLDNMVNYIIDTTISKSTIRSIDEGVIDCDLELKQLVFALNQVGEDEITLTNFKQFL